MTAINFISEKVNKQFTSDNLNSCIELGTKQEGAPPVFRQLYGIVLLYHYTI